MEHKHGLILFVLLALTASVAAYSWNIGYSNGDFSFQVWRGNNWAYGTPSYAFAHDGYYYYDAPFRYANNGVWSTYSAGWYNYNAPWQYDPWDGSQGYRYYAPNYYYWDYTWRYYPGWTAYYGPSYYGYYGGNYRGGDTTGDSYQYTSRSSCSEIGFGFPNEMLSPGHTQETSFYILNRGKMNFNIDSLTIHVDSFDVRKTDEWFTKAVQAGQNQRVSIQLKADSDAAPGTVKVHVMLSGRFADGTACGNEIRTQEWNVQVSGPSVVVQTAPAPTPAYSQSYNLPRERPQPVLEPINQPAPLPQPVNEDPVQASCNSIRFTETSMSAESGRIETKKLFLQNMSEKDFLIDSVTGMDFDSGMQLMAGADNDEVSRKGGFASIQLTLTVSETDQDRTGTGLIRVNGHFQGTGKNCEFSPQVPLYVKAPLRSARFSEPDFFEMNVPAELEDARVILFSVRNPYAASVRIRLSAPNATFAPAFVEVAPESVQEFRVSMNAAYREPFTITYYPIMSGKQLSPRQTKVTFSTETKTVSRVEITQYASEVRAGETGSYAVELHNNTAGSISLEVTLTAFKGKLFASPQTITLQPNETRFVRIPFQVQGFSDGRIEAELSVRGNAVSAQRTVTFVPVFGEESSRTQPGTTPVPLTRGEVQTPSWWQQAGITLLGMLKAG